MPRRSRRRAKAMQKEQHQLELQQLLFEVQDEPQPGPSGMIQDPTGGMLQDDMEELDPAELSNPDAVINGIRFGLAKISKLAEETIPQAADNEKKSVSTRLETCMLKLIKAETMYNKAAVIVTDFVESMPEETNSDAATILRSCEQIAEVSKKRIKEFSDSLTDEELKASQPYKHFSSRLSKLLKMFPEDDDDDEDEGVEQEQAVAAVDEHVQETVDEGQVEAEGEEAEANDDNEEGETDASSPAVEEDEEQDEHAGDEEEQSGSNEEAEEEEEEEDEDEGEGETEEPQGVEQEASGAPEVEAEDDDDGDNDEEEGSDEVEAEEEEEESEEEVIQDEEELLPTVDPITRQELKDPVRNQKCGHIYGKAAMAQLIKKNSKTKCPIAGCSNKEFIKLNQLVADRKLTMEIRKKQAEEKKQNRRR